MNAKKLKRFLSVLLSLSMALSVNTVNFAAEAGEGGTGVQVHTEADANEESGAGETAPQEAEGTQEAEEALEPGEAIPQEAEKAPGAAEAAPQEEAGKAAETPQAEAEEAQGSETSSETHVHDWVRIEDKRAATCTKAGVAVYQCQNDGCDYSLGRKYEVIPKLGHLYDPEAEGYEEGEGYLIEVVERATCQKEGSEKHICQRLQANGQPCGAFEIVDTPKTDHQWNESERKTEDANCLEAAKTYIGCRDCNAVKPGSVEYDEENHPAKGHGYDRTGATVDVDYTAEVVAPGCLTDGYTEYTCNDPNCPAEDKGKVKRNTVPALGHAYTREGSVVGTDYTKEVTTPTCTTDGGETYTCLKCEEGTDDRIWIPEDKKVLALGHGYDREDGVENTDYTKRVVAATCITDGYTEYTCKDPNCPAEDKGLVQRDKVKAPGHGYARANKVLNKDYTEETVTATCTTDGYTEYTCLYCTSDVEGHTSRPEDKIIKGGHKWGTAKVQVAEANCKDPAQYDFVCSVCQGEKGDREAKGEANADSHVFDQEDPEFSAVFKPATCKINGLTRLTCTFCKSATKFEVVQAAHDYKTTVNEPPTCTAEGTLTKVCQRGDACDAPETKTVTTHTPAAGHTYEPKATIPATCIAKGEVTKSCKTCGDEVKAELPVDPTNHARWSADQKYEATCTTPEITGKYCLDCGALHEDAKKTKDALGHRFAREGMTNEKFEEYVEELKDDPAHEGKEYVTLIEAASCKAAGKKRYTCPDCTEEGNTKEVAIPKTPHTWDEESAYVPATCTENAKHVELCKTCGEKGTTTDLGEFGDEYKATGHRYTELVSLFREETCVKNGVAQYKCVTCDLTKNTVVPAAHKYEVVAAESTAATCTAPGKEVKECKREICDDPENKKIETTLDALGHDYDEGTVSKAANCTEKGIRTKTCKRSECNAAMTEDIPVDAKNHKNMQAVTNREATCTVAKIVSGSYCDACGACSEDAVTEGEALGHKFAREGMTDEAFEAYVETLKDNPAHAGKEYVKVTKEASCTEAGTKIYTCPDCEVANNTKNVAIPALEHHFMDKYTAPTCTENGKVQKVCDRKGCGAVGGPVEDLGELDEKLGHNIVVTKGKKATCQEPGLTDGKACSRQGCGYVEVAQTEIPVDTVNGHNWAGEGIDDEDYREATCKTPGYIIHYCIEKGCGQSKPEVLPAGHDWEEKFADGTEDFAEEDTILYRVCKRAGTEDCDAESYEVLVTMPGAGYCEKCKMYVWKETIEGTPATCTEDGLTEGEKCGRDGCDYIFKAQVKIDRLGHKDTTWQTEVEPTCKDAGTEKEICGVCGKETGETRAVPATGLHHYVYKLTDATCTTNEVINSVCDLCGQLNPNNVPEELPGTALGHKFGADDVCSQCHKKRAYAETKVTAYKEGTANKIRFTAIAGVADEERYEILDRGILYITTKAYCEDPASTGAELVYENAGNNGVRVTRFPATRTEDNYYIAINVTGNEGRKLWARTYLQVLDVDTGEIELVYGEILNASYNSVSGTAAK